MEYTNRGNLRNSLKNKSYDWLSILYTLSNIISGLNAIHESNLVHCDLHDGNILCIDFIYQVNYISDLGLCRHIDYF